LQIFLKETASMFNKKPARTRMKPLLYPSEEFLNSKIIRNQAHIDEDQNNLCLLKYFPKYYKDLRVYDRWNNPVPFNVQSKVRRVKILKRFQCVYPNGNDKKILKKLFQTNRKTLKSLPRCINGGFYFQIPGLNLYFPRINSINLSDLVYFQEDHQRKIMKDLVYRGCGYLGHANRFIRHLEISVILDNHWIVILKRLNKQKAFFSSLKTFSVRLKAKKEVSRDLMVNLGENKDVLRAITHLNMIYCKNYDQWDLIQSIISSCDRLVFLSFGDQYENASDSKFLLDLSGLKNLKVLEFTIHNLKIFIERIRFPSSVSKIEFVLGTGDQNFREFIDPQIPDIRMNYQDIKEWEYFKKHKVMLSLFDKLRQLKNLKVLKLTVPKMLKTHILFTNFIFPLLRTTPQLETLDCQIRIPSNHNGNKIIEDFDLNVFFKGIESLRSLQHLKIENNSGDFLYNPQKTLFPPNLASIEFVGTISSGFSIQKFFKALFQNKEKISKNVKLSQIQLSCAQDLIVLLNSLHSVSHLKTSKIQLEVELYITDFSELVSNFPYPLYLARNTELKLRIILSENATSLGREDREYLDRVFGQLQSLSVYQTFHDNWGSTYLSTVF